jgi:membrane glycosyltransferase
LRRRGLFLIPEEVEPPAVVRAVGEWETWLAASVPDLEDAQAVIRYALGDPRFYVRHRRETRPRPRIAAALGPRIRAGSSLSPRQLFLALAERSCFDALHAAHAGSAARF